MGASCVLSAVKPDSLHDGRPIDPDQTHVHPTKSKTKRIRSAISDEDSGLDDETDESSANGDFDRMQFDTMQQEVIILSTRNANLEQQLEELRAQLGGIHKIDSKPIHSATGELGVDSAAAAAALYGTPMVPIGYLCDELDIDPSKLSKHASIEHLEALLCEVDSNLNFTSEQLEFVSSVSADMDEHLMGLLNILLARHYVDIFWKCVVTEMVSFIYHESDNTSCDGDEQVAAAEDDEEDYDIIFIYDICQVMGVQRAVIDEVDALIKQKLGSESNMENLFIEEEEAELEDE